MIESCININIGLRAILNQSARKLGLSRSALVHLLFLKILKEKRLNNPKLFTRIKYQDADPAKAWKCMVIDMQPDMFEKCQDLRKVLKMSVSFILAYGIQNYLEQVINECLRKKVKKPNNGNNYFSFYSIERICNAEIEGFLIQWEKTKQISVQNP